MLLSACASAPKLESIKLPPGLISVYCRGRKDARAMVLGEKGAMFTGTHKRAGYKQFHRGEVAECTELAFRDGELYVSDVEGRGDGVSYCAPATSARQ